MVDGEVVGGTASEGLQLGGIPSADAPDILHGEPFQGGNAVRVVVDEAAVAIDLKFFGEFRSDLGEGLVGGQSDTDGHPHRLPDALVQVFAPVLECAFSHLAKFKLAWPCSLFIEIFIILNSATL